MTLLVKAIVPSTTVKVPWRTIVGCFRMLNIIGSTGQSGNNRVRVHLLFKFNDLERPKAKLNSVFLQSTSRT